MEEMKIIEIKSDRAKTYKDFFTKGLIDDEENFRMTPADDVTTIFPTEDKEDSFTLWAFMSVKL